MKLICSGMLPFGLENGQQSIIDCIHEQFEKADQVELAVGYISKASLIELNDMVERYSIQKICLNIGMHFIEGMPESSYRTALDINAEWNRKGIGEIRLVKSFKYHGNILKSPEKACKINDSVADKGVYYTTTTPFLKKP